MQLRERFESAKKYTKEHAPQIITAVSVLTLAVMVAKAQKDLHGINRNTGYLSGDVSMLSRDLMEIRCGYQLENDIKSDHAQTIREAVDQGRDFTYYPEVGVHVHPEKKVSK